MEQTQIPKNTPILEARNIRTWFLVRGFVGEAVGHVKAVDDVSLSLYRGENINE